MDKKYLDFTGLSHMLNTLVSRINQKVNTLNYTRNLRSIYDCLENVAWEDSTTKNDDLITLRLALGLNVGWDLDWTADSTGTLPEGMTSQENYIQWVAADNALLIGGPSIDFNWEGPCEFEVTCKWGGEQKTNQSPQLMICKSTNTTGRKNGFKIFGNPSSGRYVQENVSGTVDTTPYSCDDYHTYNLKLENDLYTFTVDGDVYKTNNLGTVDNAYLYGSGIWTRSSGCSLYIKDLKFRRIAE